MKTQCILRPHPKKDSRKKHKKSKKSETVVCFIHGSVLLASGKVPVTGYVKHLSGDAIRNAPKYTQPHLDLVVPDGKHVQRSP